MPRQFGRFLGPVSREQPAAQEQAIVRRRHLLGRAIDDQSTARGIH
jgi:hypothetical protein